MKRTQTPETLLANIRLENVKAWLSSAMSVSSLESGFTLEISWCL